MALEADGRRGFTLAPGHKHPTRTPTACGTARKISSAWRSPRPSGPDHDAVARGDDRRRFEHAGELRHRAQSLPAADAALFPQGLQTNWVKPGRAVWSYLDGGKSTLEGMKEFTRLAGELGFEYHVIEGFWRRFSDAELKELITWAGSRASASGSGNTPRNCANAEAERTSSSCAANGRGGREDRLLRSRRQGACRLLRGAAPRSRRAPTAGEFPRRNKPTGRAAHLAQRVGARVGPRHGVQQAPCRARHDATLPFTRFLAGHADYTPVHFGPRRADTTWAHQVATAVVFTSPLLTYAAHPQTFWTTRRGQ